MDYKGLMIESKLKAKRAMLKKLIQEKGEPLQKREAELQEATNELGDESTEEEIDELDKLIDEFEDEKKKYDSEKGTLESEIETLEKELKEEKEKNPAIKKDQEDQEDKEEKEEKRNKSEGGIMMKRGFFAGMTAERRSAVMNSDETKDFCERLRRIALEKREVKGEDLTIPENLLEIMREQMEQYSKLIKHINLKKVRGKARQNIAGTIPEGIWMEMKGALKELDITFNQIEVDGYKVGGFVAIPNSVAEDSDLNMVSEVMTTLSQAIGIAVDKAILYGSGKKMPTGIVTRLAQTSEPDNWDENNRKWKNISTSNILKFSGSTLEGAKFFKELIKKLGVASEKYSDGRKFWAMSSATKTKILAEAITFNAAGAVVSSVNNEMPVIGGTIETFDFMQDGDIVGGYGLSYVMSERSGASIEQSEHAKFIEDMTVVKGTARYDGLPVIGEAFVAVNIENENPKTEVTFAGQQSEAGTQTEQTGA